LVTEKVLVRALVLVVLEKVSGLESAVLLALGSGSESVEQLALDSG
jgi:hypothetical protein